MYNATKIIIMWKLGKNNYDEVMKDNFDDARKPESSIRQVSLEKIKYEMSYSSVFIPQQLPVS